MNKDEDQDWLDALAGKQNANADPEVARRAAALRQAIQRHNAAMKSGEADVEIGLHKLKFRLRREDLSGGERHTFLSNRYFQFAMAATVVLTVGLTMRLYLHEQLIQNEAEIMRGGGDRQIVLAPDPEARLKQLTSELDRLGIKYQIERKERKILLKAHGVDPVKDDVATFLEQNQIKTPVGMDVELDIRPMAKP